MFLPLSLSEGDDTILETETFIVPNGEFIVGFCSAESASSSASFFTKEIDGAHIYGIKEGGHYDNKDTFLVEADNGYSINLVYYETSVNPGNRRAIIGTSGLYTIPSGAASSEGEVTLGVTTSYLGYVSIAYEGLDNLLIEESTLVYGANVGEEVDLYLAFEAGYSLESISITYDNDGSYETLVPTINGANVTFTVPDTTQISISITSKSAPSFVFEGEHITFAGVYSDYARSQRVYSYDESISHYFLSIETENGYVVSDISIPSEIGTATYDDYNSYLEITSSSVSSFSTITITVATAEGYKLSVRSFEGGTLTLSSGNIVTAGTAIYGSAILENNYRIISIVDNNDASLNIEVTSYGSYCDVYFVMPSHDVDLLVTSELVEPITLSIEVLGESSAFKSLALYDSAYYDVANQQGTYSVSPIEQYYLNIFVDSNYLITVIITEGEEFRTIEADSSYNGAYYYSGLTFNSDAILTIEVLAK